MLTQVMALELSSAGIRVNAVCSGEIATHRFFPEELTWAQEQGMEWADYRQRFIELTGKRMPLGRIAEPEDIAAAAGYLLSPASSYITGEIMDLTGASRWVDTSVTV
jgi:NAD(P)-dependent dehydrogenase (short-subunit alcohol dehydrogenase family)